jgi:mannitol-1-phosphate 5-dehydrogenase
VTAPPSGAPRANAPTVLVFGAGAVGRGLIGELFSAAGWAVSFLDVDDALIAALNADGGYRHLIVGAEASSSFVGPVRAGHAADAARVVEEVLHADCIATAVGVRALPTLAPSLRAALLHRFDSGGAPVDILLCENLHDAPRVLRELLTAEASPGDAARLVAGIPSPTGPAATTDIAVEPYGFLPVDASAQKTDVLRGVPRVVSDETVGFGFYVERKLHIHNMGHFLCGLLGELKGHEFLWQAAVDPEVRDLTRAAMVESAAALAGRYRRPVALDHVEDLLHRFANRALRDPISRVIRDPARKMEPGDRVLGAYRAARSSGTPTPHLSLAVAAGTLAVVRDAASRGTADVADEGHLDPLTRRQLAALRRGFDYAEQVGIIGGSYDPPAIP